MKLFVYCFSLFFSTTFFSQSFKNALNQGKDKLGALTAPKSNLSSEEIVAGLKEALNVGASGASGLASKMDGFYKNPAIFIPWPEEAKDMKSKLSGMGMSNKIIEFEQSLNRAAEEASKTAATIFLDAIKNMSVQDGYSILKGTEHAATEYLIKTTSSPLKNKFMPIVKEAISKTKVTAYWEPLANTYNTIPFVKKQNPNLDEYITDKAIAGLMYLIAEEEAKIRKDPMARASELLKKVFGN